MATIQFNQNYSAHKIFVAHLRITSPISCTCFGHKQDFFQVFMVITIYENNNKYNRQNDSLKWGSTVVLWSLNTT